ncbi:MAG TPA: non-homologous end-joining DNA ligase [Candidatus Binatia bacterium]|jgi:DNA ligase D-like protein (predicted ligase)|nr:non-homologous end-joining DNA ligase [Candidatus Binatia bacterium]
MNKLLQSLPKDVRRRLKKKRQPSWTAPMLATLTDDRFSDPNWIFDRKFDGERVLVFRKGKQVRLLSRNKKLLNNTYPELVDAYRKQPNGSFIVDGEVVAFQGKITSFSRLQGRMKITDPKKARKSRIAIYQYLFDLLFFDGYDTTRLSLRDRKALLRKALKFNGPVRFTAHRTEKGEKFHKEACKAGLEGLIAKNAESEYVHTRSRDWLKFKCVNEQEFVIGGYTEPQGSRIGFGALLVGYYKGKQLKYAGMVGTGYDDKLLRDLGKKLRKIENEDPPFSKDSLPKKNVHWVKPRLVGQVGFTEWTGDGKLRHPRFKGLRRDKKPKEVVREKQ